MEFLDTIGEYFSAVIAAFERFVTWLFGASNERTVRRLGYVRSGATVKITPGSVLDRINQLEPEMEKLSEGELRASAARFRERLSQGQTLDDLLPEAFAAVREAGKRYIKMRHYDVQMIGGYVLHNGMIAEMVTGEGKTLVSTLPAFLNALSGSVHVVTVNDYLALRDMEWMAPLHMGLGLSIGAIQANMEADAKAKAYQCDITYGTNNEFGFDYLRDNMKALRRDLARPSRGMQVQGPLNYAIVDEIDNILIDEARTPLIISGPADDDVRKYAKANQVALQLKSGTDFEVKEKEHTCHLTDEGIRHAEEIAGVESFYTTGNMEWPHLIDNSLKAHHLYKRDVNYVVQGGEVIIVDEFTGRLMPGRNWSDGLHQAVEAKEGVRIKEENQTLATITLQNFFKLYKKLSGMTGTAMTEANEFWKIYKLDVVAIPTNRPMARVNHPDVIFRSEREKFNAIVDEVREVNNSGRPILVGTVSIEKSELLSSKLNKFGIKHEVLNAKHHEREADIIAQAGRLNGVTIATNMAGRGTDIILGGNPEQLAWDQLKHKYASRIEVPKPEWDALSSKIAKEEGMADEGRKVAELGGLHVIGSERHDARRIDLQLRGRSGRQGDPGSSRFFLSLEDDLMRIFGGDWVKGVLEWAGMQEGEAIESRMVSKRIEGAQKKREEQHFETRKHLLEYDEVMDQQRRRVYTYRQHILDGGNCRELIMKMVDEQLNEWPREFLGPAYGRATCADFAAKRFGIEVDERDLRDMDVDRAADYLRDQAVRQGEALLRDQIDADLPEEAEDQREWNWGSLSKWVNLRYGLNTNDRELKKVGREEIFEYLLPRIEEAIAKFDFSPLNEFLADNWGRRQLSAWLKDRFTLDMSPEEFEGKSIEEVIPLIKGRIEELYERKEIMFPVTVGLTNFMSEKSESGDKYNREGLVVWANHRFQSELNPEEFKGKARTEIAHALEECSQQFYRNGDTRSKIDQFLDRAYGDRNGHENDMDRVRDPETLRQLTEWANSELQTPVEAEELEKLTRKDARLLLEEGIEHRYRPELSQAERSLILEFLDNAWKDHLYFMDHLRQGIGLAGYAGKDPKTEYKREGMKAFDAMWKRVNDQVTSTIFRLEENVPDFVGSLWRITATTHDLAPPTPTQSSGSENMQANSGEGDSAVEPIRNRGQRVGRNDPCPCGSGKKFKNCHMNRT